MPQLVWSAVPISLTEACRDFSIPSYIGWMFLSESCTNSAPWCSTACTVKRLSSQYLVELCQPIAGVASRQHLRSATQQLLVVPRYQLGSYGRRAFCVAGLSVWNSLLDIFNYCLRNPIVGGNSFRQSLKTYLFATYWCIQCIRGFTTMRYIINRPFTYLLTFANNKT